MTTRLSVLIATAAVLGFLVGARAVGIPRPAEDSPSAAGVRELDPLRGGFWRPAGSEAERPALELEPSAWAPPMREASDPRSDALAAVRAALRLASLE
jgi:hypothetical protein